MSSVFATALGGLNRATLGVQAVAGNVANLNTPGYRAVRVNAGTGTAEYRAGAANPTPLDIEAQPSDVDLATELIDLKRHEQAYQANATLIDFENRRLGELLDLLG